MLLVRDTEKDGNSPLVMRTYIQLYCTNIVILHITDKYLI